MNNQKLFKLIYYPVLVVTMLALVIWSTCSQTVARADNALDVSRVKAHISQIANSTSAIDGDVRVVADYVQSQLVASGVAVSPVDADDFDDAVLIHRATMLNALIPVDQATVRAVFGDDSVHYFDTSVRMVVVVVPGSVTMGGGTGDAILYHTSLDSATAGQNVASTASNVAIMIEHIRTLVDDGYDGVNDLVFVFGQDAADSLGLYTFVHQFRGFDSIATRVRLAIGLYGRGTSGPVSICELGEGNSNLVSRFDLGTTVSSSVQTAIWQTGALQNFDFGHIAVANFGDASAVGTPLDTLDNADFDTMSQKFAVLSSTIASFGDLDLGTLDSDSDAVFFNYLGLAISFDASWSFVFGALLVALVAVVVVLATMRRAFSWAKLALGALVQALTVAGTIAALFVSYYICSLFLAGFGFVPAELLGTIGTRNIGLLVAFGIFAVCFGASLYIILKRSLAVRSADVVRGNAMLWAVISAVLAFVAPTIAYMPLLTSLLLMCVMLVSVLVKGKFQPRFGIYFEQLYAHAIPVLLTLPLAVPIVLACSSVLSIQLYAVLMALCVMQMGTVLPYFDYLKAPLDRLAKKLPKYSVRVEREVTEVVEHAAKKGKFTSVTSRKITRQKRSFNYYNRIGLIFVAVVGAVVFFCSSGYVAFGLRLDTAADYDPVFDNSLVYVWQSDSGVETSQWQVRDIVAFSFFRDGLEGFGFDNATRTYSMVNRQSSLLFGSNDRPTVTVNGNQLDIHTFPSSDRQISITLHNVASATQIVVDHDGIDEPIKQDNLHANDTITINLPRNFARSFTVTAEGASNITFEYVETHYGKAFLQGFEEIVSLEEYLVTHNPDAYRALSYGLVLRITG